MGTSSRPSIQFGDVEEIELEDFPANSQNELANVIVEFRTLDANKYDETFGFDWMRVWDGVTHINVSGTPTPVDSYESKLKYGYNPKETEQSFQSPSAATDTVDSTSTLPIPSKSVFDKYKEEFEQIQIKTTTANNKYYVPYLNIYPASTTGTPMPTSEVELRVLLTIDKEPDRIEIEFDNEYFSINGKDEAYLIPEVADTEFDTIVSAKTIKLKCKKEFSVPKYLNVYQTPIWEEGQPRPQKRIAGKLYICPNDRANRKIQKVLFIPVTMRDNTGDITGRVYQWDKDNISKHLYQTLTYAQIETYTGTFSLNNIEEFTSTSVIFDSAENTVDQNGVLSNGMDLFDVLLYLFSNSRDAERYKDQEYIYIFVMPVNDKDEKCLGVTKGGRVSTVEENGEKKTVEKLGAILLFPARNNSSLPEVQSTASHEVLHALGLKHPFYEGIPLLDDDPQRKVAYLGKRFVFNNMGDTDNLLDYNQKVNEKTTWKWQWDIIHRRVK